MDSWWTQKINRSSTELQIIEIYKNVQFYRRCICFCFQARKGDCSLSGVLVYFQRQTSSQHSVYSILTRNEGNFGNAALKPSPNPPRPTESRLKLSLPVSKIEFRRFSCLLPCVTVDSFSSGTESMSSELFCNCQKQKFVSHTNTVNKSNFPTQSSNQPN